MLTRFRMQGFRCFRDLELTGLGRVNLLVGPNGVGKSTVLEGMAVWAGHGAASTEAINLLLRRQEARMRGELDVELDVPRLFHNVPGTAATCRLNGQDERSSGDTRFNATVEMALGWVRGAGEPGGPREWLGPATPSPKPRDARRDVQVTLNGATDKAHAGGLSAFRLKDIVLHWDRHEYVIPLALQGALRDIYDDGPNDVLWNRTTLTPRYDHLIEALRLIRPDLEGVSVLAEQEPLDRSSVVFARTREAPDPVPLKSLGGGVEAVFHLALAAVNVEGGLLLVDEIENGLHFSIQEQLWRFLFALAEQTDVQIFATTHSWDCIQAFQAAAAASPSDGALIRLQRDGDDIVSETFTEDDLAIVTRSHIEVRW